MITSIILAGGSSTRFGMDKNMLIFGDNVLLARIAGELAFADELLISISNEEQIRKYDLLIEPPHRFIVDDEADAGAFGGLYTSARAAGGEIIALAPCDTPFVSRELYELLLARSDGHDGAAPRTGGHWEPLVAVYRKAPLIALLEKKMQKQNVRLSELCTKMDVIEVNEKLLKEMHIPSQSFMNINKPEDLENALDLL
jgi:molybdopterin-guanine dinucleotide biosynthesis protein A